MKNIEDYLHLYLGCEIKFDKSCRYLVHNFSIHKGDTVTLTPGNLHRLLSFRHTAIYKIILRPLSDMTEEEKNILNAQQHYDLDKAGDIPEFEPEQFIQLLKWRIDLFGLIEAGVAIDKTTLRLRRD